MDGAKQIHKVKIYSGTDNFQTTKRQIELHMYKYHGTTVVPGIYMCVWLCVQKLSRFISRSLIFLQQ